MPEQLLDQGFLSYCGHVELFIYSFCAAFCLPSPCLVYGIDTLIFLWKNGGTAALWARVAAKLNQHVFSEVGNTNVRCSGVLLEQSSLPGRVRLCNMNSGLCCRLSNWEEKHLHSWLWAQGVGRSSSCVHPPDRACTKCLQLCLQLCCRGQELYGFTQLCLRTSTAVLSRLSCLLSGFI